MKKWRRRHFIRGPEGQRKVSERIEQIKESHPWMTRLEASVYEVVSRCEGENGLSLERTRVIFEEVMDTIEAVKP